MTAMKAREGYKLLIDRAERAEARADAAEQALRVVLDCKGSYEGTVSENGGRPAICTACEDVARAALAGREPQ